MNRFIKFAQKGNQDSAIGHTQPIKSPRQTNTSNHQHSKPHKNVVLDILESNRKNRTQSAIQDNCQLQNQGQQQIQLQSIPQPLQSEEDQCSKELEYLSYIVQLILDKDSESQSLPIATNLRQQLKGTERSQFLSILYKCAIYVKKQNRRTKTDDSLLIDKLAQHIQPSLTPSPKNMVGMAILSNGYCVCAFAILWARINNCQSILEYMFRYFNNKVTEIEDNYEEYIYYSTHQIPYLDAQDMQGRENKLLATEIQDERTEILTNSSMVAPLPMEQVLKRSHINDKKQIVSGTSYHNQDDICNLVTDQPQSVSHAILQLKNVRKNKKEHGSPIL